MHEIGLGGKMRGKSRAIGQGFQKFGIAPGRTLGVAQHSGLYAQLPHQWRTRVASHERASALR
jgi:hypothetical protein